MKTIEVEIVGISPHCARIWSALKESGEWMTSQQVAKKSRVAWRTSRSHLLKLYSTGLVERVELFDAFKYRVSPKGRAAARPLAHKLDRVAMICGVA